MLKGFPTQELNATRAMFVPEVPTRAPLPTGQPETFAQLEDIVQREAGYRNHVLLEHTATRLVPPTIRTVAHVIRATTV